MRVPIHYKVKVRKVSAPAIRAQRISEIEDIMEELPLMRIDSLLWEAKMERRAHEMSDKADFERRKRHTPSKK